MKEDYLAYFKYSGQEVENGYLDLKKSAEALNGIDSLFRFYINKKIPELSNINFELPARVRKGSWETLIPENIGQWIAFILGTGVTTYSAAALKEMAKNDFKDKGFKDLFKQIVKAIKWSIQIAKHIGTTSKKTFDNVLFKEENGINFIGIRNESGNILYVPKMYLELFSELPPQIFNKLSEPIERERELYIDFSEQNKNDKDDTSEASIEYEHKHIFYQEEEENEILFPELEHGMFVELNGHVTRGNEKSNTIGFLYKDHILTCYPEKGNIIEHKIKLFTNCLIRGYIDRKDKKGFYIEKRPRIKFIELVGTEKEDTQQKLF
ncbi:hypothetical protein [uncultured Christiangramia sp.]|uniref:hypothetical protein n=1 Tax=Christiangramia sp. 3-2217-3z TaxID=3417564 RepID=UPI002630A203|nr:hypothetical protein [uncultured Christiangramia sp.]